MLTARQADALRWLRANTGESDSISMGPWREAPASISLRALHALEALGFAKSMLQSEQVRGERRIYWREWQVTDAGRNSLQVN
jgi:hypothetical protein